jgi:predicted nucleic acid-binding protein
MPRDQWHAAACKAVKTGMTFFTSSLVINEAVSLLQSRGHLSAALLSFASLGIRIAFTFDQHFRAAGFQTLSTRTKS